MIHIQHPASFSVYRKYIFHIIFHEFLGLKYSTEITDTKKVIINLENKSLTVNDHFFSLSENKWLQPESLPLQPLSSWSSNSVNLDFNLVDANLPVIFGKPFFKARNNGYEIGIDIFGSAFFMLSRYEEIVKPDRDLHDRFPIKASLAFQEGFLCRPIVDEYVEVLWGVMLQLWPGLQRREQHYQLVLTHDVDRPFGVKGQPWWSIARRLGGDLVRRKNPCMAAQRVCALLLPGRIGERLDPNNTFDWIMDNSEKKGAQSEFYFMAGKTSSYDSNYDLRDSRIQHLLRRIHDRGHIIGLHPSYGTLGHPDLLLTEANTLRQILEKASIPQEVRSGRQHYLRWQADRSWADWEVAGLKEDSSVGFAEQVGFRAGTCRRYQAWSWAEDKPLNVTERPLIAMEGSLLSKKYMNLDEEEGAILLNQLTTTIKKMKGEFVVLWHNDSLTESVTKYLYKSMLEEGCQHRQTRHLQDSFTLSL